MSWEVSSMPSKRSSFNWTLFKKDLSRFWPLWGGVTLAGCLIPLYLLLELMSHTGPIKDLSPGLCPAPLRGGDSLCPRLYHVLRHSLRHGGVELPVLRQERGDDARPAGGPPVPVPDGDDGGAGHAGDPLRGGGGTALSGDGLLRGLRPPGGAGDRGGGAADDPAVFRPCHRVRHDHREHLRHPGPLPSHQLPGAPAGRPGGQPDLPVPHGRGGQWHRIDLPLPCHGHLRKLYLYRGV